MSNELSQDPTLVHEFLVESEELLQRMDQDLIALEGTPNDAELLNRVFRALHTIKGTSSFLGYDAVVRLSHRAEDVLNGLRRAECLLSRRTMDALLQARDQLGKMLEDIREGTPHEYSIESLLKELETVQKAEPTPKIGELLVANDVVTEKVITKVLKQQQKQPEDGREKLGELLVQKNLASVAQVDEALAQQKQHAEAAAAAQQRPPAETTISSHSMRVDVRKLDDLINLVGELVLERNRLMRLSRDVSGERISLKALEDGLSQCSARLSFITEELQTVGLKTRMVPIDTVFRKFPRLVRDIAHNLGKEIELEMRGQETELDKTMVELIGDPLVHLVRNSLDHGLETPERREMAGKPRCGTIRLEARQEGEQIVISISDDGGGIDPERIASKAVEKGLVTQERVRQMDRREILEFIFLPGFSTVEKAGDLSGRGVGMDVVRTNLRKLNGSAELESEVGRGTTVLLKLPLTLAILPVLLVQVADEIYALPLRSVLETARISSDEIHHIEGCEVLRLRQETLPLVRLRNLFELPQDTPSNGVQRVVILRVGERKLALLVDELVGQESTVIKPLGTYLRHCSSLTGATISGDGRVRLVLDPSSLAVSARSSMVGTQHGPRP
ncbi:MAG TPA: chemotaxis protein CheA [Terriglobales bacterium]|nr:chemotaxis protein CheA [Terriglobales bacterium]